MGESRRSESKARDVQQFRAPAGGVREGVVEGVEGAVAVDGELEARLAREVEHLDRDAVVVG